MKHWKLFLNMAVLIVLPLAMCHAAVIGMEREGKRQEIQTQHDCQHYGAAMNNWARQNKLTPPCAE
jgi:hypothetical protein